MKLRYLAFPLALLWPVLLLLPTPAQKREQIDDVRDAFLVTRRRVAPGKQSKPVNVRTKQRPAAKPSRPRQVAAVPIGIGYTLYHLDANGNASRVAPTREFRQGDAVRLVFEANTDGYLYVFHTENGGPAQLIFPDARLNQGDNRILAHVPYEVPSSKETDPRLRWFFFDKKPAIENLYVVVTKTPLPEVPTGERLVAHCRASAAACPWRPAEAAWNKLVAAATALAREGKSEEFGQALTAAETEALERGIGLGLDAPPPSIVKLSQSPQAKQLVVVITLTHK